MRAPGEERCGANSTWYYALPALRRWWCSTARANELLTRVLSDLDTLVRDLPLVAASLVFFPLPTGFCGLRWRPAFFGAEAAAEAAGLYANWPRSRVPEALEIRSYSARARELILGIWTSTDWPGSGVVKKPERPAIVEIGSRSSGVPAADSGLGIGIGFAYSKPVFPSTKCLQV
jgi:hypothetical protein